MDKAVLEGRRKFLQESFASWNIGITSMFPNGQPDSCEWKDKEQIIAVLRKIGANHTFFPTGGGLDLTDAKESKERGCIEIYFGGNVPYILIPKKLIFVGDSKNPEWAFFYLEAEDLEPTSTYVNDDITIEEIKTRWRKEELVRLPEGRLLTRLHWDEAFMYDEYGEQVDLPEGSQLIERVFNGKFVIFGRCSPYMDLRENYDGIQDKMSFNDFVDLINQLKIKRTFDDLLKII